VPWRGRVDAPALLRAGRQVTLYTAEPGRLAEAASQGAAVAAGAVLYRLESVDIARGLRVGAAQLAAAQADLASRSFDAERRRAQQAAAARASEAAASLAHAEARAVDLDVRAPFAGYLTDVPRGLVPGADLRRLEPLGILVDPASILVDAYVGEADLDRVAPGSTAVFLRPQGERLHLVVSDIAQVSTRALEAAELASLNGGPLTVRRTAQGVLVPERAVYRVQFAVRSTVPIIRREPGHVVVAAPAESLIRATWRRIVALLQREAVL
jgi:putative peptide zinc metalloprotease protein